MEDKKKSPQVSRTTSEDAWYCKENKFLDFGLPVISLVFSIVAIVMALSN